MREKIVRILDNVFVSIFINLLWNLGLWFLFTNIFLFSGEITKDRFAAFWSTSYPIAIISIVITLIGKWTSVQPKSYLPSSNSKNIFTKAWRKFRDLFWIIVDILNFSFWFIFDSWRKPNVELFTRMPVNEVVKAMVDACNEEIESAELNNRNPTTGYFSKSYFSLLRWSPTPFGKVAVVNSTILYGKIYNVKKGVFIRAWHRLPTAFLLFMTLWFGGFTNFLLTMLEWQIGSLPKFAFVTFEILGTMSWVLLIMWISTKFARAPKEELNIFLKNILAPITVAQHSVQPTSGSLRVF